MANPINRGVGTTGQYGSQSSSTGGSMESLKEQAKDIASTAANRVGEVWESTKEGAQQVASTVASGAEEAWDTTSEFFRRYSIPLFFLGIGLGYVLARALNNISSDMARRMSSSSYRGNMS